MSKSPGQINTKHVIYAKWESVGAWIEAVRMRCVCAAIVLCAVAMFAGLPGKAFAEARVRADFNGDGFDDLAIGASSEDIGSIGSAGGVNVIYGSASGLTSIGNQFWSQNSTGILDTAEVENFFGSGLSN